MRPEAVTPPPQKEWCPANMAAVFGLFMGSVAICNVSSLQVLCWFFASSLLELHVVLWGCGVVVCVCVCVCFIGRVGPKKLQKSAPFTNFYQNRTKMGPKSTTNETNLGQGGVGATEN